MWYKILTVFIIRYQRWFIQENKMVHNITISKKHVINIVSNS